MKWVSSKRNRVEEIPTLRFSQQSQEGTQVKNEFQGKLGDHIFNGRMLRDFLKYIINK